MANTSRPVVQAKSNGAKRFKISKVTVGKRVYYRVYLGPRVLGKGAKSRQVYFDTPAEAKTFVHQQCIVLQNSGTAGFSLTERERVDAAESIKRLAAVNATLPQAVEYYFKHAKPAGGTKTFVEAASAFITSRERKKCRPRYITNLRAQIKQLETLFKDSNVNELRRDDIETGLASLSASKKWNPKTSNNYLVTLRALFTFCCGNKWCAENPGTGVDKARIDEVPIAILKPDDVISLLTTTLQNARDMVGPFVIGLFAGLRRSEVCELDWQLVHNDRIEVAAKHSKTRRRRFVDISPNLAEWLTLCRKTSGRIFAGSEDDYNEMRRLVAEAANVAWPHNALRHSCASYHLAYYEDSARTAFQLGHSEDVLFRYYRQLVTKPEASKFWRIYPVKDASTGLWSATIRPKPEAPTQQTATRSGNVPRNKMTLAT